MNFKRGLRYGRGARAEGREVVPIAWTLEQCGFQAPDSPRSCRR